MIYFVWFYAMCIGLIFLSCFITPPWQARRKEMERPYVQYESPEFLDKRWGEIPTAEIPCTECGWHEAPIFRIGGPHRACKWCLELANLRKHLQNNGRRRFTKAA